MVMQPTFMSAKEPVEHAKFMQSFSNCNGSRCCERRRGKPSWLQSESLLRARKILERTIISHHQPLDMSRDPLNTARHRLEHYDTLVSL